MSWNQQVIREIDHLLEKKDAWIIKIYRFYLVDILGFFQRVNP